MLASVNRVAPHKRWWTGEAAFAAAAFLLLSIAAWAGRAVVVLVGSAPLHQGSPLEFAVALLAVLSGWLGLACLVEGPGLLSLVPAPPRRWM